MTKQFESFPSFKIPEEELSVGEKEIFAWIERIVAFGPRKPATEGDEKTRAFISEKFVEFGLDSLRAEPVPVETSQVREWRLSVTDERGGAEMAVPSFHIPFPAPTQGEIEAEMVYIGDGRDLDRIELGGKIAVFEQEVKVQRWGPVKQMFFFHDPAGSIPDDYETFSLVDTTEREIHDRVVVKDAVGMVGLLSDLPWESDSFCPQMNHGVSKKIPGFWVSPKNAEMIKSKLAKDNVVGKIKIAAEQGHSVTYNVRAVLPGQSDEYYIVMGHHDAPFANSVQDASGMSVVLALAKHFSQAKDERPLKRGIIFLAIGGHTLGRLGETEFVKSHGDDLLPRVALLVSIEHVAREFVPSKDLAFACSDQPAPRMFLTSRNDCLGGLVRSSILHNNYGRSIIIPQSVVKQASGKARGISGEFYEAGVPVIGLLSNPPYMFFKEDTPETVARDQLVPTANAVISILRAADTLSLDELKFRELEEG